MTNIYDEHAKIFNDVSAYVIIKKGYKIGTISLKYPEDEDKGAYCFFHLIGSPMVCAYVTGYLYIKKPNAIIKAIANIDIEDPDYKLVKNDLIAIKEIFKGMHTNRYNLPSLFHEKEYDLLKAI